MLSIACLPSYFHMRSVRNARISIWVSSMGAITNWSALDGEVLFDQQSQHRKNRAVKLMLFIEYSERLNRIIERVKCFSCRSWGNGFKELSMLHFSLKSYHSCCKRPVFATSKPLKISYEVDLITYLYN